MFLVTVFLELYMASANLWTSEITMIDREGEGTENSDQLVILHIPGTVLGVLNMLFNLLNELSYYIQFTDW